MTQAQQQTGSSPSSSSAELRLVNAKLLSVWADAHAREHIEPACDMAAGEISVDNAMGMVSDEHAQLWALILGGEWIATIITEIAEYTSGKRVCRIMLAGADSVLPYRSGALPHIPTVLRTLEDFARAHDCTAVRMDGRKTLGKLCPEYKEIYRSFEKDLRQ